MKKLLPIFILVLCYSGYSQVYTRPNPQRTPAVKPTPKPPTFCFSDTEIQLDVENLPIKFSGNDIKAVAENVEKRQQLTKDEFETTQQFRERVDRENAKPVIGNLNYNSLFIFEALPDFKYDADTERMLLVPRPSRLTVIRRDCDIGFVFPAEYPIQITVTNLDIVEFPVKLAEAKNLKPNLRLFVVVKLSKPDTSEYDDKPLQLTLQQLWITDRTTGQILHKIKDEKPPKTAAISKQLQDAQILVDAGRFDEASSILRRVLLDEPMNAMAYYLLGVIHRERGDAEQAITSFKTSVFWDGDLIKPKIALVRLYIKNRDCGRAKVYFEEAKSKDPNNAELVELESSVSRCR